MSSSGGKNIVHNFLIVRRVVDKLSLFVGGERLIMVGRGWLWVAAVKLWLVVGGDDKIMAERGWWL